MAVHLAFATPETILVVFSAVLTALLGDWANTTHRCRKSFTTNPCLWAFSDLREEKVRFAVTNRKSHPRPIALRAEGFFNFV